jgi:hypothetical protein
MMSHLSGLVTQLEATLSQAVASVKSADKGAPGAASEVVDRLVTQLFDAWKAITAAKLKGMLDEQTKLLAALVQRCSLLQQCARLQGM